MTNAKRGRGSRHGFVFLTAAALSGALSACGGGTGSPGTASLAPPSSSAAPPTGTIGAVTLNWMPPTENTDGTPLTNLAGYSIHLRSTSGTFSQTLSVSNPGIATYVVDNLTPGAYLFSVVAVNSAGTESPPSAEVSATVN